MMSTRNTAKQRPAPTHEPLPLGGPLLWLFHELTRRRRLAAR